MASHSLVFILRRHSLPDHSFRQLLRQSFTRQSLPVSVGTFKPWSTASYALACVRECDEPVRAGENVPSRQNGLLGEIPRDDLPRHLLLPLGRRV
jgi:hypothetical protein